jgi:hypothetical protein
MANDENKLSDDDKTNIRTLLHEAIPITSSIISGTYGTYPNEGNIKNYSHGMFQSVYDYPYLSSSANHIFDITAGYTSDSSLSGSTVSYSQVSKKINIYNQLGQILMGYDATGSIQKFDEDGDLSGGTKMKENLFLTFSRLLVKDEIKKGSFSLSLGVQTGSLTSHIMNEKITISDKDGNSAFKVNSPTGEYGILYATGSFLTPSAVTDGYAKCGLIFYQAGIAVITGSIFNSLLTNGSNLVFNRSVDEGIDATITGSNIQTISDSFRRRIDNLQFNNTTELNSMVYFCRVGHQHFNYSGNPTYLSQSQIYVKNDKNDLPVSYITTVGLYDSDQQLVAVGKLSEPLRKDPTIEYTIRARLDF